MSNQSDNSLRLAEQLRATALKNLGRSAETHRSAITGKFLTARTAKAHPATSVTEGVDGTSSSARSGRTATGRFVKKARRG